MSDENEEDKRKLLPLNGIEQSEIRAAAFRVTRVLPPNLARFLSEEFHAWINFGYRFGDTGTLRGAIKEINELPTRSR